MNTYCDINDAYNGALGTVKDNDLEKLARQINTGKKKRSNDMYKQYRSQTQMPLHNFLHKTDKDLSCPVPNSNSNFGLTYSPIVEIENTNNSGFYSAQGEYKSPKSKLQNMSEDISLDTPSLNDSDSSISSDNSNSSMSSMTWDTSEVEKHIKSRSKFNSKKKSKRHRCVDFDLDSVDSLESLDSGESLLKHIRFCKECKDRIVELIRKNNLKCSKIDSVISQNINQKINQEINTGLLREKFNENSNSESSKYDLPEIKEIITVILIGFLVIIILDLLMRYK